mmetsp:Transcript_7271/g.13805  ORF Transcript_7271/g.13805 Transcript_7271/m.13805 type:complete len:95 (-) Transcript_7271:142-426(-)
MSYTSFLWECIGKPHKNRMQLSLQMQGSVLGNLSSFSLCPGPNRTRVLRTPQTKFLWTPASPLMILQCHCQRFDAAGLVRWAPFPLTTNRSSSK